MSRNKKVNDYGTGIPVHEMEALARILLPEIEAFYATEDGIQLFETWIREQNCHKDAA